MEVKFYVVNSLKVPQPIGHQIHKKRSRWRSETFIFWTSRKKKKNLISNYNQMYDDLHMPMLTREMLMELHEQLNFTLKLLVT